MHIYPLRFSIFYTDFTDIFVSYIQCHKLTLSPLANNYVHLDLLYDFWPEECIISV